MLGQERIADLLNRALNFSQAEETEVTLVAQDGALTRFAGNTIHQNVAERNATLTIRAVVDQRVGLATTNNFSDKALAQAAGHALSHARQQPPDPDFPGLPQPRPVSPVEAFDQETAAFSPAGRAGGVAAVCAEAARHHMTAAGAFRTTAGELAIANSNGLFVYHASTLADLQTVVTGREGTGWAQASSRQAGQLQAQAVGQEATQKAARAQSPRAIEPGRYTVILEPYAVADLLLSLNFYGVSAQAVQEGRSWMNGRLGQQIMSSLISIWDDGQDPAGLPLPFDFEGVPRQRVPIVEQGIIRGPVYDRYTAAKDGVETTGHASPPGLAYFSGPLALNLFMAGGDAGLEEMIQATEYGLAITRFWYTRLVHPRDCVVTGMTRDGVMVIENGRLAYPVKDLRFTQSYVEGLTNVQAASRETWPLFSDFAGAARVPALKIEGFHFTGVTV